MQRKLTDKTVRALSTDDDLLEVWDTDVRGFGVRVSGRTGRKTFFVRYRIRGEQRRESLGPYPAKSLADARAEARVKLGTAALGQDPNRPALESVTVREVAEDWLTTHARPNLRQATVREYERQLKADIYPRLGSRRVAELNRADIHGLLDALVSKNAPVLANRVRSLLGAVLDHAVDRWDLESNVVRSVRKPKKEVPRRRVLTPSEIQAVWGALSEAKISPDAASAFRLLFLTAQRKSEVLKMRASHIDGNVWTIPPENHKGKRRHTVPLSPQALATIGGLKPRDGWLFPSSRRPGPRRDLRKALQAVRKKADLEEPWTIHDIRRSVATQMGELLAIPNATIGEVLGHRAQDITSTVYSHAARDLEKRRALVAWGDRLLSLVSTS